MPDEPLALDDPRLHVIPSGHVLPNRKRQIAAEATRAKILAFIDDDAYPDRDWLANAIRHFADANVVAAGGPAARAERANPWLVAAGIYLAHLTYGAGTIAGWFNDGPFAEPTRRR